MTRRERDGGAREREGPGEGREVELKLEVPGGDLAALKGHPLVRELSEKRRPRVQRLQTVYYDTPGRGLAREGLALRVRRSGRSYVQALKGEGSTTGGLFVRGEWEARLPGPEPDLERIPSAAAQVLARRAIDEQPLEPVFETDFKRTRHRLRRGDTELWLDLDEGEIRARGASAPLREVELELVSGDAGVLYEVALELHEAAALRPSITSKAQRGHALATGARPAPERAPRIELAPGASLEEALRAVLAACLGHVLANQEPAREGSDPEGVHQLRVGLRRTRAALALLRDALGSDETRAFEGELRWLASELGPARDLDVLLAGALGILAARLPDDPGLKRLRDAARELRDEAYVRVRAALDSPRASALALGLGGELASRGWRGGAGAEALAALEAPAAERGAELLDRRLEKARRLGRHLARRTPEERHRLRIALKKLRYAGEFLGSLYGEKEAERMLDELSELQDTLGALNDVAMAERLLATIRDRLGPEWRAEHERGAGFVLGWISHEAQERLARLAKQWKALRKTQPFWRS